MKKILLAFAALALVSTASIAQDSTATSAPPPSVPTPAGLTSDFQRGWCAGFLTAVNTSIQNYNGWVKFLEVGQPKLKTDKSALGESTRTIIASIPKYILLAPQTGKVVLNDGTAIDCATYGAR